MENKPKIIAKTSEEFNEIFEKLKTLPDCVQSQISIVEDNGVLGLECTFKEKWGSTEKTWLPKNTTQISDLGDYIGVYCGEGEFFFKLLKKDKIKIDFVFV